MGCFLPGTIENGKEIEGPSFQMSSGTSDKLSLGFGLFNIPKHIEGFSGRYV